MIDLQKILSVDLLTYKIYFSLFFKNKLSDHHKKNYDVFFTLMFWLIFHLICILNVQGDPIKAKKVQFFENKFWDDSQKQAKTERGFLSKVSISIEDGKNYYEEVEYYFNTCHLLQLNNNAYVVIDDEMAEHIASCSTNQDGKCFLKIEFLFTEDLIEDHLSFEKYLGKKQVYTVYKRLTNEPENIISISKYDDIDTRMFHIKERIAGVISMGPLTFEMFNSILENKRLRMDFRSIEDASEINALLF
ncbi:hypothetical protein NBO_61g0007 [Nosema bombycis CQ1]|uniref:Uncharacterized protein n=1 Tax=Nosema bombycis (strain CQ1 / CVCC 102059) TaxID=578461 RepID=R0KSJ0_NOSB1|nr:hypothetical protein NBO_61g0007 [Nosema bombycis CQ1]|eukprot:EOB13736.1 hypothetical protein NBO_61g0007 [Nosema bombycis CQ1]